LFKQFNQFFNSLKTRIIFSALFMVLVLLPLVGFTIADAYEKHMVSGIKNELTAYSYSILAVAEVEQQKLQMPDLLLENQFNVNQSGLYAMFTSRDNNESFWRSKSLLTVDAPVVTQLPNVGEHTFNQYDVSNNRYFVYSFSVSFFSENQSFETTLHIIKLNKDFTLLMREFRKQLWLGLLALMAVLVFLQLIWLKWSLKPLAILQKELVDIEQGKNNSLQASYPKELDLVTNQLNTLLKTEQNQRKRYRNALADLAHSLKTPLAVIQAQGELSFSAQEQLDSINLMIEHQLKRAQSAGQSSWHLGVKVSPCLDKLITSLNKIYRDKSIEFRVDVDKNSVFKGDESDLFEILGNLLDNACKAAKSKISISIKQKHEQLIISIEDDGSGIELSKRQDILQRGTRVDTYQQGHGIGLAIVRDLVESYQGRLLIEDSITLCGAKFTLSF